MKKTKNKNKFSHIYIIIQIIRKKLIIIYKVIVVNYNDKNKLLPYIRYSVNIRNDISY